MWNAVNEHKLHHNLFLLGQGIELCIENKLNAPALVLTYTAIDTVGWLDSDQPFATRSSFLNWVDRYLLKAKPLRCTSLDLYAARCGLLHSFTPDSQLSADGRARRLCYAWGEGSADHLQQLIDLANANAQYVSVHVGDLYEAWRLGLIAMLDEVENDSTRAAKIDEKAKLFYSGLAQEPIAELLDVANGHPETL